MRERIDRKERKGQKKRLIEKRKEEETAKIKQASSLS